MNRKRLLGLVLLLLIGSASAAMWIDTYYYKGELFCEREKPSIPELDVMTMFRCGAGYTNACDIGVMGTETLIDREMMHINEREQDISGLIMLELECEEGFTQYVYEIERVRLDYPTSWFECTDRSCVNRVSDTKVLINMTDVPLEFDAVNDTFTNIELEFHEHAYGNYTLTAYVLS